MMKIFTLDKYTCLLFLFLYSNYSIASPYLYSDPYPLYVCDPLLLNQKCFYSPNSICVNDETCIHKPNCTKSTRSIQPSHFIIRVNKLISKNPNIIGELIFEKTVEAEKNTNGEPYLKYNLDELSKKETSNYIISVRAKIGDNISCSTSIIINNGIPNSVKGLYISKD